MPYCTQQDLINRFGEQELIQLTDRDVVGAIDTTVLNQAIADADAEINSYLTGYSLPLASIPANLLRIGCDITRYYLAGNLVNDQVRNRYKDAIAYLTLVSQGKISLAPDISGAVEPDNINLIEFSSGESVFSRGSS